jgi:hypothetical protein
MFVSSPSSAFTSANARLAQAPEGTRGGRRFDSTTDATAESTAVSVCRPCITPARSATVARVDGDAHLCAALWGYPSVASARLGQAVRRWQRWSAHRRSSPTAHLCVVAGFAAPNATSFDQCDSLAAVADLANQHTAYPYPNQRCAPPIGVERDLVAESMLRTRTVGPYPPPVTPIGNARVGRRSADLRVAYATNTTRADMALRLPRQT